MRKSKLVIGALVLAMAFSMTACGSDDSNKNNDTKTTKEEQTKEVTASCKDIAAKVAGDVNFDDDKVSELDPEALVSMVGLDEEKVTESTGYFGSGSSANTIFVAKLKDSAALDEAKKIVDTYLADQKEQYASYLPDEVSKIESAVVKTDSKSCIIAMVISGDAANAKKVLEGLGF